jgi:hypothetical protein
MAKNDIVFSAKILRKQDDLPRYIIVPAKHLSGRSETFGASVRLNDSPPFERNVRPWGKGSDAFFFNLTAPQCKAAKLETGDECLVTIQPE